MKKLFIIITIIFSGKTAQCQFRINNIFIDSLKETNTEFIVIRHVGMESSLIRDVVFLKTKPGSYPSTSKISVIPYHFEYLCNFIINQIELLKTKNVCANEFNFENGSFYIYLKNSDKLNIYLTTSLKCSLTLFNSIIEEDNIHSFVQDNYIQEKMVKDNIIYLINKINN